MHWLAKYLGAAFLVRQRGSLAGWTPRQCDRASSLAINVGVKDGNVVVKDGSSELYCHLLRLNCHLLRLNCHLLRLNCHLLRLNCHLLRLNCHLLRLKKPGAAPGTDWMVLGAGAHLSTCAGWNFTMDYQTQLFRSDVQAHFVGLKVAAQF